MMSMIKKTFLAFLFTFLAGAAAWGQLRIAGTVYDENHNTLPGAAVFLQEDPENGTLTDDKGQFELTLKNPEGGLVCVSFMGYESANINVSNDNIYVIKEIQLKPDRNFLDEVVVTGTRTPKLLKDVPIITRVISTDDIRRVDATNVADLLQSELPGIEFSYQMNQQLSLNMTGFGGNSVLFLVDGERVAGETLDNIDYSRLNLDNVGKIEIVKGAASSLYGSNAVGGVVNLISKTATEPWSVNVNARYGAFNELRYGTTVGFKVNKVSNSLNFQGHQVDDIPLAKDDKSGMTRIYANQSYNVKDRLVWTPSRKFRFTANAGYFFRQREPGQQRKERYRGVNFGLKGNWSISDADHLEGSYTYDEYDKSDFTPVDRLDIRDYCNVQQSGRLLYNHVFRDKHTLTAGTDYMYDYLMSYQFEGNGFHTQHTADVFAQFDWNPIKKFNLIAGVRYDYFSAANKHNVAPKLSLMYKLDNCSLRASYAAGFRAPTLKEMFMNFNMANIFMIYGNKDLRPEYSHNLSLSAEYMQKHWNVTVTGFYNFVKDRITTAVKQGSNDRMYMNMAPLQVRGIDASVSMNLDCGFGARVSYVFTDEVIAEGQPLLSSTRPVTMTARVNYGKDFRNYGFDVSLSVRYMSKAVLDEYVSGSDYTQTAQVIYPDYSIWKLNFSQTLYEGVHLNLMIDNLFNYIPDYYYGNSPTTTGTTASIGLSLDIEEFFKR